MTVVTEVTVMTVVTVVTQETEESEGTAVKRILQKGLFLEKKNGQKTGTISAEKNMKF